MSSTSFNKILLKDRAGFFVGYLSDNLAHRHYALQCSVSLQEPLTLYGQNGLLLLTSGIAIKPMIEHRLVSRSPMLIILLNPASRTGHFFHHHFLSSDIDRLPEELTSLLQSLGQQWFTGQLPAEAFYLAYTQLIQSFVQTCLTASHHTDSRILDALDFLEANADKVVPLAEAASHVFLSPERFRHLFQAETGITFRRLQLWNKLVQVFQTYSPAKSLTELAHEHGFSDSAHLSRTFKETFGLSPTQLFNNSRFIQD
ncbi:AraC family transcriptional regulator [Tunicatimonas pelagia]|uniref:AraC family transcriptional regulator n=1 Tax=Tunicatimonas pelagia TaxID=931531 RepID=UPI0026669DAB|nr:AraC family transcriptional regulator [Tunicatimonas pelagia]WKN45409.1 AraC family transcriptional regulator [Tunicatimonas pelagia]